MAWLKNIIFYRDSADYGANGRKYRLWHKVYIYTMLVCMGLCIGLVSLVLASSYLEYTGWEMFLSYFRAPLVLLLNLLPPVLLILFLYFAAGRAWIAFGGTSALVLLLSLINFYKIRLRSDPFIAADIALAGEAGNILSQYTIQLSGRVWFTVGAVAVGLLFAALLMRGSLRGRHIRLLGAAACVLVSAVLYGTVYTSDTVYEKADNSAGINVWSELQVFVSKGFIYPFIHSIPDAFPAPPDGYDAVSAAALLASYAEDDIPETEKVNIVSIMLEAYTDLSRFEGLAIDPSVYAPLHTLQQESWSGNLISNVFAGGTINTERSFLTGYTQQGEYRCATDSYVYYLKEQGYYTEGFHAGDGWFYNRMNVHRWLGFDNYYFLEDYVDSNRTDAYFFEKIKALFAARDKAVPYFSYSLTYQNHGAYDAAATCAESYLDGQGLSAGTYNILNNYLSGVADTTARLAELADYFRNCEEPVVLILFGDHMPWLGNNNSVYSELGINLDTATETGFYNYYATPYIIWANTAAKTVLGSSFVGDGGDFSPCYLMNTLFDLAGWGGSAYMKAANALRDVADVVHSAGVYRIHGVLTDTPDSEEQALLDRHLILEYYMKHRL